jgi:curli production assembly/transport component CsgF
MLHLSDPGWKNGNLKGVTMKSIVKYVLWTATVMGLALQSGIADASELVWTPINPSFGGSPLNGSWLLASAQMQDKIKPVESEAISEADYLKDFQARINSQILYKLSDQIMEEAFGEGGLIPEGEDHASYNIGTYNVDVSTSITGISVKLTDLTTGGFTTLTIPYF